MSDFKNRSEHLQFCQDRLEQLRAKRETIKQATDAQLHDLSNEIAAAEIDVQNAQASLDEIAPRISAPSAPAPKVHAKTASDDVKVVTKQ